MVRSRLSIALIVCVAGLVCSCSADTIWDYEAVDSNGIGTHPLVIHVVGGQFQDPTEKVTVEGVALAGVGEILNPNSAYTLFVQDTTSDRGGLQAWAGSWFYTTLWPSYRQNYYVDFQAGDRLRITGYLADANRGKVVINHLHSAIPDYAFQVTVLDHPGLPDPQLVGSVSNCNYFDQTRAGGGERWQTRYVMLHGVELTGGTWGNNANMTISDPTGSVGMLLSTMGDFSSNPQPSGKLNVVGIFDQEDTTPPCTENYRVWVKRASDVASALDCCRQAKARSEGDRVALVNKVVSRRCTGYFYVQDQQRTGGVRIESSRACEPGDVVCVQGLVSTSGGEKIITPTYLSFAAGDEPKPLAVNSRALWAEHGLDVRGLLVRCFAKVGTDQGAGIYTLTDDAGRTIRAQTNGFGLPAQDTPVIITGVAHTYSGAPILLISNAADVQTIQ